MQKIAALCRKIEFSAELHAMRNRLELYMAARGTKRGSLCTAEKQSSGIRQRRGEEQADVPAESKLKRQSLTQARLRNSMV